MTERDGSKDWWTVAEGAVAPSGEPIEAEYWQQRLYDAYALEVQPFHGALWQRALGLLATYGKELCWTSGPLEQYPQGAPLSTGVLLLREPKEHGRAQVMNAVRLSVADSNVRAKDLPKKLLKAAANKSEGGDHDAAVRALDEHPRISAVQVSAYVLSTIKEVLHNTDSLRGKIREAKPPVTYRNKMTFGTSYPHWDDVNLNQALARSPEVALYCRPLELFSGRTNSTYIRRPHTPELRLSQDASLEDCHNALRSALRDASNAQLHGEALLDMMMCVTQPVRSLGKLAVVKLPEGDLD